MPAGRNTIDLVSTTNFWNKTQISPFSQFSLLWKHNLIFQWLYIQLKVSTLTELLQAQKSNPIIEGANTT